MLHTFLLSTVLSVCSLTCYEPPQLIVEIAGVTDAKGSLLVGIYDSARSFPKDGKALKVVNVPVRSNNVRFAVDDLPAGTYAIALCHDVNGDGEFNTNFVGMPLEPYGFSNDVKPTLSAPSVEKASFEMYGRTTITITLQR